MDTKKSLYKNYTTYLILADKVKEKLSSTYLYSLPYTLFNEYQFEALEARHYAAENSMDYYEQGEIDFYILMDYLTFIPFGDLGRRYCAEQKIDIASLKYMRSLSILKEVRVNLNEEEAYRLKLFFDTYDNNLQPINPVGYANIVRKLQDRIYNMAFMRISECFDRKGLTPLLSQGMLKISKEISSGDLKEYDVEKILTRLPNIQSLDESQIAFLKDTLRA